MELLELEHAVEVLLSYVKTPQTERVPLMEAAGRTAARKWASSNRALRRRSSWRADQPPSSTSAKAQHAAARAANPAHSQLAASTGRPPSASPQACPMTTRAVPVNAADPIRRAPTSHVARLPDFDTDTLPISVSLGTLNLLQHGVPKIADAVVHANTPERPGVRESHGRGLLRGVGDPGYRRARRAGAGRRASVRNLRPSLPGRLLLGAGFEG